MIARRKVLGGSIAAIAIPKAAAKTSSAKIELADAVTGFGVHVHDPANFGLMAASLTPQYIRLWDTKTTWADLEPKPQNWNFDLLDRYVSLAKNVGAKIIYTLGQTPGWAAENPEAKGPYGVGRSSPPRDMAAWSNYVRMLAERYNKKIQFWELWNEFNNKQFYSGSLSKFGEMAIIAARELRANGANNFVLSPSIQGGSFREFSELANSSILNLCDAVSYHFYAPFDGPEESYRRALRVRKLLDDSGRPTMPIWNTEIGWRVKSEKIPESYRNPPWSNGWKTINNLEAANFIVRSALLNLAAGIPVVVWYAWDNAAMGMGGAGHRSGDLQQIAAFQLATKIAKSRFIQAVVEADIASVTLEGMDGRIQYIWAPSEERSWLIRDVCLVKEIFGSGPAVRYRGGDIVKLSNTPLQIIN